jgi:HTH-type transcriptional regulator / antitoxin MqsA
LPHIELIEVETEVKEMKNLNNDATKALCPICGEGHVTPGCNMVAHEYHGQSKLLPLYFTTCDTCTSESAGLEESRANKRAVLAFRKEVDGLLTGAEIRALRDKYKLTQGQAAKLFGGGPVAFSKYENDDVAHSEAMDTLLRLVGRNAAAFWDLVDVKGMSAELAPTVIAEKIIESKTTVTNVVVMADFRDGGFRTSEKASFTYPTETRKWK